MKSIIALIGTLFVVFSLGEIASIYPTAGGNALPSYLRCPLFVLSTVCSRDSILGNRSLP